MTREPSTSQEPGSLQDTAQQFVRAIASVEPDRIAGFYTEEALAMYPLPHATIGREANHQAWVRYFGLYASHPIHIDTVVVAASQDIGYTVGRFANAEVAGPGVEAGRFVTLWRREAEGWRIAVLSAHVHPDIEPFGFAFD